jgi:putative ABC transport system substrate-binding protein
MRRREFIAVVAGALTWPVAADAQQTGKMPRIGILNNGSAASTTNYPFFQGLRELGYTEGQNLAIEFRFADWQLDRLAALAAELVALKVDVIVAGATPAARAAKQATTTIPIVAVSVGDPVGDELVASLGSPGGNVTGNTFLGPELVAKRLQLFRSAVPGFSRLAAIWHPGAYGERTMQGFLKETEATARKLGIELQLVQALYAAEFVDAGGLMSYGANLADLNRRAATYVDKILKGTKPADLPVEQPTKFELLVNLKTARELGLTISREFLLIADEVIE